MNWTIILRAGFSLVLLLFTAGCASHPVGERIEPHSLDQSAIAWHGLSDFRLLFADEDVLKDRVERQVCFLQMEGRGPGRKMEWFVGSGVRLENLLKDRGNYWNQARLVLVKERAILQRPDMGGEPDGSGTDIQISQVMVVPGDLLYSNMVE